MHALPTTTGTPSFVAPRAASPPIVAPWTLRAWPPLLWQARQRADDRLRHLGTRVTFAGDRWVRSAGQTLWGGSLDDGDAGVAWDWVQITRGVVTLADPMSVVTNLRLVGAAGEVLTAHQAACDLHALVHALPWQGEVERALRGAPNG
jgi:hypothetical protein